MIPYLVSLVPMPTPDITFSPSKLEKEGEEEVTENLGNFSKGMLKKELFIWETSSTGI